MPGFPLGLTRFTSARARGGAGSASPNAAGTTYTVTGLKVGSSAVLYGNGTQLATATVDSTGKATWTLGAKPAAGTIITYDGVVVGSGGTVPAGPPAALAISGSNGTANVGDTASFTPTISGGTAPYTVAATGLPPGRAINNAATGLTTGAYTTAGSYSATYTVTDSLGATASFTRTVVVAAASLTNLSGAAPRVAVTDATYWIRTGGTLARSTDTSFENNIKANTTVPFASQQIPSGSIGYVSIKHAAVTADVSPPLFINWDGNASLPSTTSPLVPTVWVSNDSATGSPDDGTWAQDTSFAAFRPTAATDAAYTGRGQRYFWPTAAARWVQVRFDVTVSGMTQNVTPHICCSSGQWLWTVGMSIIRNQYTNISAVSSSRAAFIANAPGSDPFFFVTARSGANQAQIKSEQVDVVLASTTLKKFLRAIYVDTWVNDIAYVSQNVRPYSVAAGNGEATLIRNRSDGIFTALKGLNTVIAVPDCSFLNFTTADGTANASPYVNSDFQSANGAFPYNQNVFGPAILANVPTSWDAAYGMPFCSDYAGIAEKFETDTPYATGDSVHPNGTGYTNWRSRRLPLDRMLYGLAPNANTLQTRVAALGSTTTTALKTRLQSVFDAVYAMYPTADSTVQSNRAALRAQLDAITAT